MRIGLITTLDVNIGDDLIREGIIAVLKGIFTNHQVEFVAINKHRPLTVYPRWHPAQAAHVAEWLPRGRSRAARAVERVASRFGFSYFDECDLIVQCGAPVLWPGCHQAEWAEPLWHHVVGRLSERVPVLNLAAGSCYPWEQQPATVSDPQDQAFLQSILSYCRLTTVRDQLAARLCTALGAQTPVIPCSALLAAADQPNGPGEDDGVLLVNYMKGGGHYSWNQDIDPLAWQSTIATVVTRLKTRHRVALLCHSEAEKTLAAELDPTLPRLLPRTPGEYFHLVAGAKAALCNRMHAAVALAALGIPSVAIGTDSRLLMAQAIGLPCHYVRDASADRLEEEIEGLVLRRHQEQERLAALRQDTWQRYTAAIASALGG